MTWSRTTLLLSVLLASALAGCGGSPGKPADRPDAPDFGDFDLPEDTLAVRGVVVDEAIVPLGGAHVTLDGVREANTTAKGTFAFADVEPGVHVIKASKPGYFEASTTVTVAGLDDPIARILLAADAASTPYHETISKVGFLQCGIGLPPSGSYSTCQTPNGAVDILCDASGDAVCLDYPMQHRGILEMDVQDGVVPTYAQAEAVWDATSPNSEVLTWGSYSRTRGTLEFNNGTSYTGPTSLIIPWERSRLVDGEIGQGQIYVFQVFPQSGGVGNLVLQQQVELFMTTFYHYLPPEGWSLGQHGSPTPPA